MVIQAEEVAEASERQAVGGVEHQGVVAYPVKVVVVKAESVEIVLFSTSHSLTSIQLDAILPLNLTTIRTRNCMSNLLND